jgi:hypothetical protein
MKCYITIGVMFLMIIFVSFRIDEGDKVSKKLDDPDNNSKKITSKKVNIDQLTLSEMKKMTVAEFNSYFVKVKGDHGKYIKRFFEAKAPGIYNTGSKLLKSSSRDECDGEVYVDLLAAPNGQIKDYDIDRNLEDSAPIEWIVAQGGPGFWEVRSFDRVYMIDLDSNPANEFWQITKVLGAS